MLCDKAHGLPSAECATALYDRLPEYDVRAAATPAEERELASDSPVVVGVDVGAELVDRAESLEYFAAATAGTGHLPMDALTARGVAVTNAAGVHVPNVPEHVLGWMLTIARRLDEGWRRQQERRWEHFQAFGELAGSTVTVVGLGAIGTGIVERLQPFDVHTVGVRYTPSKGGPTDEVIGSDETEFREALSRTDYLVLACPLTETTCGLVGAREFETLPEEAVVINVTRGPVVDTDALVGGLRRNEIHGAAIDVIDPEPLPEDHPLWNLEDLFITPHVSGHTWEYWERVADIVEENVGIAQERGAYRGLVNQVAGPE
ncbi:MAG: D-2-hydroxyacid dehydrogenase [Haloarculaceae archaeon]